MNSGERMNLKDVFQIQQVTIGGVTTKETVRVGEVIRARPGPRIDGPEYIALVTTYRMYRWNDLLSRYDPETINDDPIRESRWVES